MSLTEQQVVTPIPPIPDGLDPSEEFTGGRYSLVAWARGQTVLVYTEFGSYQGDWVLFARDDEQYYIYQGSYGSCSGCDSYEAEFSTNPTRERAWQFVQAYQPFIVAERAVLRGLAEGIGGEIGDIFPANHRDSYSEISYPELLRDIQTIVKLEEGLEVELSDILETRNSEVKQRALKAFGYERFVEEANPEVIDDDGRDSLLRVGDVVLAYLLDHSTDRRYLLRVPPNMTRIKQAIAWTFGVHESQYQPLVET